ncbi:MAG: D-glycero-beta-D-manno-heptose 1,7-bisphosphate 7-phosphatase [Oscillospiraceae bacterium]|nr:D-glycero-beta-D-manno-heptose 1,7-bisphosphate 7-phosphatase [Oscillospiraceae bacterium]
MKAVFLDRDGTINVDTGYVYKPEDFRFAECAPEAIKMLNDAGYMVIVISNQSGIGRGMFTEQDVISLHKHIDKELAKHGARIDAYYFCPHKPEDGCACRKPKPAMILEAAGKYGISLPDSWMVGDKPSDVECAKNAGVFPLQIKLGYGAMDSKIFGNLHKCVTLILQEENV